MTPAAPRVAAHLVDTHAHLTLVRQRADLESALKRAADAGIAQIITIGTTAATSRECVALTQAHRGLFAAVGIHPNDAAAATPDDWDIVTELVERTGVVAVGETGLDRHWDSTPFPQQQKWFDLHLNLALKHDLPVVIHCRDCQHDIIEQLADCNRSIRGVMHSFTGSWEEAQTYLDLGLHLSFAGMVTFTNKSLNTLRDVVVRAPLERILVETDSPYLTPHPRRGQPNEPAHMTLTAARMAELRGLSSAEFASITTANARKLFRLPVDETLSE